VKKIGVIDFVKSFFGSGTTQVNLTASINDLETKLAIEEFAIASAISLIANSISKCEFRTFLNNKEVKGDEYYLWNIEPNKNQNSSQFIQELVWKLLYYNEALVFEYNNQLFVADSFNQEKFAMVENYFTGVCKEGLSFDRTFKMSEVLYFKYNNWDVKRLLSNLQKGYTDLINMSVSKYQKSGGRKGILKINTTAAGNKDFEKKLETLMNDRFKRYFTAENAVLPLEDGYEYNEQNGEGSKKSTSEVVDIVSLVKEIFERTAQAYKIPPALLRGDIADIEAITDNYLTFCIDPLTDLFQEEIIRKRYGKKDYLEGSYISIDTTCIRHIDIFSIAEKIDKLIASGTYSIDEIRRKMRDIVLNEDWSQKHYITKNYSEVDSIDNTNNIEGGG